jgi:hypothetical protein
MLVRERDSILNAVGTRWNVIRNTEAEALEKKREAVRDSFRTDVRVLALGKALSDVGVMAADEIAHRISTGNAPGYTFTPASVRMDLKKAIDAAGSVAMQPWGASSAYSELSIATSASTLKWAALQAHVYLLISEMGSAKTGEEIEKAVRTFTAGIS